MKHILWSARDSRVVKYEQASDGWTWGASLWLTLGEKLVSGEWLPSDSGAELPPSLVELLSFARSKNVSLCPYVYPCASPASPPFGPVLLLTYWPCA